ncbi:MAG: EamA family transporter [Acidimicrobiales bacterium]
MAILLALGSAVTYGIGDFCGGLATRRATAAAVLLWSHLLGFGLLGLGAVVVSSEPTGRDLALGSLGGLAGAAGVGLLYQALAIGPMSVVAPITALLAAAVPVLAGFAQGERPAALALGGMALALAAIVMVSAEGGGSLRPKDLRGVTFALGAGLGFGLFFVALSYTGDDSGLWPLVTARLTSVTLLTVLVLAGRTSHRIPAGPGRPLAASAGALDALANLFFLLAIREGLLSVVSVLTALYPVSTVVLARLVLKERFARLQQVGMALAIPAAIAMAL